MVNPSIGVTLQPNIDTSRLDREMEQFASKWRNNQALNLKLDASNFSQPLGRITSDVKNFDDALSAANKRVLAFGLSASIMAGMVKSFHEVYTSMVDVDKALIDVSSTFEMTNRQMKSFGNEIFNIAKLTGSSFKDAAEVTKEFARQNLSVEETLKRSKDALTLHRLSGLDLTKSIEGMTTAMNVFNKAGLDSTTILNKMVAVDRDYAISAGGIIEALTRVGSVAEDAHVSFDQLVGLITAAKQITGRDAPVIGNALKTIFTRIERPQVIADMEALGVSVRDAGGKILPVMDIFGNLAKTYKTLGESGQQYVSQLAAGVFQINQFKALIKDYGDVNGIAAAATKRSTEANEEAILVNDKYNQSLDATINRLKQSASQASATIGDGLMRSGFGKITSFAQSALDGVNNLKIGTEGQGIGGKIGEGILDGIGNVLSGPGLVKLLAIGINIAGKMAKSLSVAIQTEMSSGIISDKTLSQQTQIIQGLNSVLKLGTDEEVRMFNAAQSVAEQQQIIVGILQRQNQLIAEQYILVQKIQAASPSFAAQMQAMSPGRNFHAFGYIPNAANGLGGAITDEYAAIAAGIGGAGKFDTPVTVPNFNFGNGRSGIVVANSGEWIVKNFNGSGGDAIFNKSMIQSMGLPAGARPINAASGLVPNFAGGADYTGVAKKLYDVSGAKDSGWAAYGPSMDELQANFAAKIGQIVKKGLDLKSIDFTASEREIRSAIKGKLVEALKIGPEALEDGSVKAAMGKLTSQVLANESSRIGKIQKSQLKAQYNQSLIAQDNFEAMSGAYGPSEFIDTDYINSEMENNKFYRQMSGMKIISAESRKAKTPNVIKSIEGTGVTSDYALSQNLSIKSRKETTQRLIDSENALANEVIREISQRKEMAELLKSASTKQLGEMTSKELSAYTSNQFDQNAAYVKKNYGHLTDNQRLDIESRLNKQSAIDIEVNAALQQQAIQKATAQKSLEAEAFAARQAKAQSNSTIMSRLGWAGMAMSFGSGFVDSAFSRERNGSSGAKFGGALSGALQGGGIAGAIAPLFVSNPILGAAIMGGGMVVGGIAGYNSRKQMTYDDYYNGYQQSAGERKERVSNISRVRQLSSMMAEAKASGDTNSFNIMANEMSDLQGKMSYDDFDKANGSTLLTDIERSESLKSMDQSNITMLAKYLTGGESINSSKFAEMAVKNFGVGSEDVRDITTWTKNSQSFIRNTPTNIDPVARSSMIRAVSKDLSAHTGGRLKERIKTYIDQHKDSIDEEMYDDLIKKLDNLLEIDSSDATGFSSKVAKALDKKQQFEKRLAENSGKTTAQDVRYKYIRQNISGINNIDDYLRNSSLSRLSDQLGFDTSSNYSNTIASEFSAQKNRVLLEAKNEFLSQSGEKDQSIFDEAAKRVQNGGNINDIITEVKKTGSGDSIDKIVNALKKFRSEIDKINSEEILQKAAQNFSKFTRELESVQTNRNIASENTLTSAKVAQIRGSLYRGGISQDIFERQQIATNLGVTNLGLDLSNTNLINGARDSMVSYLKSRQSTDTNVNSILELAKGVDLSSADNIEDLKFVIENKLTGANEVIATELVKILNNVKISLAKNENYRSEAKANADNQTESIDIRNRRAFLDGQGYTPAFRGQSMYLTAQSMSGSQEERISAYLDKINLYKSRGLGDLIPTKQQDELKAYQNRGLVGEALSNLTGKSTGSNSRAELESVLAAYKTSNPNYASNADTKDAVAKLEDAIRQIPKEIKISMPGGKNGDYLGSFAEGFKSQAESAKAELWNLASVGKGVYSSLDSNLGNSFGNFVTGAQKGKDAFRTFATSVLSDAARMMASKAMSQLLSMGFNSLFGSGTIGGTGKASGGTIGVGFAGGGGVNAMLTGGEFVFTPSQARAIGGQNLRAINSGSMQKFADGGMVRGGSGVRDDVAAKLQPGSFVIKKSAVQRYGSDYLSSLASGGVQHRFFGGWILPATLVGAGVGYLAGGKKGAVIGAGIGLAAGIAGNYASNGSWNGATTAGSSSSTSAGSIADGKAGWYAAHESASAASNGTMVTAAHTLTPMQQMGIGLGAAAVLGLGAALLTKKEDTSAKTMTAVDIASWSNSVRSSNSYSGSNVPFYQTNPQGDQVLIGSGYIPATRRFAEGGSIGTSVAATSGDAVLSTGGSNSKANSTSITININGSSKDGGKSDSSGGEGAYSKDMLNKFGAMVQSIWYDLAEKEMRPNGLFRNKRLNASA